METTTNNNYIEDGDNSNSSVPFPSPDQTREKFMEWDKKITSLSARLEELKEANRKIDEKEEEITQFQSTIDSLRSEIMDMRNGMKKMREVALNGEKQKKELIEKFNNLEKREKEQTRNAVELLGVFITFFTFISVSVSIVLQFETVFHAVFVLMSFLTGLMIFLYVFHHLLHHEHKPLELICYEPGKSRCISLIKHLWKTGNFCYSIPFVLAVLCGFIALLIGPDNSSSYKKEGAAHINYIQNVPTSKINVDQSRNEGEAQVETTKNSKTIDKNHK